MTSFRTSSHLRRCVRDLKHEARKAKTHIEICVCEDIDTYDEGEWFCPDSSQRRTRSRRDWQTRERILMLMPMFVYERVAS